MIVLMICLALPVGLASADLPSCRSVKFDWRNQPITACKCGERQCHEYEECLMPRGDSVDYCRQVHPFCTGDLAKDAWDCFCGDRRCRHTEDCKKVEGVLQCVERPEDCSVVDRDEFGLPIGPCICAWGKACAEDEYCQIARGDNINYCVRKYCTGDRANDPPRCICGGKRCGYNEDCKKDGNKLHCVEKPEHCSQVEKDEFGIPIGPCLCAWDLECEKHEYCNTTEGIYLSFCENLYCTGDPAEDSPVCICENKRCNDNQYCRNYNGKMQCTKRPNRCEKVGKDKLGRSISPCVCGMGRVCEKHEYCNMTHEDATNFCLPKYLPCKLGSIVQKKCLCGNKTCKKGKKCKSIKGEAKCLKVSKKKKISKKSSKNAE